MTEEKALTINGKDEHAFLAAYLHDLNSVEEVGLNWAALVDLHDFYCNNTMGITPEYVFRMWGGQVPLNVIEEAFRVYGSRLTGNS